MEVVQVCPLFFPYFGGIETHVREISKHLTNLGVHIKIYTTDPSGKLPKKESIDGIEVLRFRSFTNDLYFFAPKLYSALKKLKEEDMIHVHSPDFPSLAAALAKDKNRKPIVFTPHTLGSADMVGTSMWRTLAKKCYTILLGKYIFDKFDAVVTVSKYEKKILIQKFGLKEGKITYIPNGVDVEKVKGVARKKRGVKTILYVGRLEKYKGIHFLIKAFPKIKKSAPHSRLIIIGSGSYKKNLIYLVDNLGIKDSVIFLENVSEEELREVYTSSSVFISLPQYELFGIALAEAMAYGLPVIATKVGGIPEFIQPNRTGFLLDFPPDENILVKIATFLLENTDYSTEIGIRARQAILSRFSWDRTAHNLFNLYRNLLMQKLLNRETREK